MSTGSLVLAPLFLALPFGPSALAQQADVVPFGPDQPGSAAPDHPELALAGAPLIGAPFALRLYDAAGLAFVAVGGPAQGAFDPSLVATLYPSAPLTFQATPVPADGVSGPLFETAALPPGLAGLTLTAQGAVFDILEPSLFDVTGALQITFGVGLRPIDGSRPAAVYTDVLPLSFGSIAQSIYGERGQAADMDGDGREEHLATGAIGVQRFPIGPDGIVLDTAQTVVLAPFIQPLGLLATGDFDGDGRDEIVVESAVLESPLFEFSTRVWGLAAPGDTEAEVEQVLNFVFSPSTASFATGDADGDGIDDLFVLTGSPAQLRVHLGSSGGLGPATATDVGPFQTNLPPTLAVGDVNGDGLDDAMVAGTISGAGVWTSAGDGSGSVQSVSFLGGAREAAIADLDGGGLGDVIAIVGGQIRVWSGETPLASPTNVYGSSSELHQLTIVKESNPFLLPVVHFLEAADSRSYLQLAQDPAANPNLSQTLEGGRSLDELYAADVDGDGGQELYALDSAYRGLIRLERVIQPVSLPALAGSAVVQFADLFGSASPETVAFDQSFPEVRVLSGSSSILSVLGSQLGETNGATLGDVNGDGELDVAIVFKAQIGTSRLLLGAGDGAGGFGLLVDFPLFTSSNTEWRQVEVADVDGDGANEIVVSYVWKTNPPRAVTRVFRYEGEGSPTELTGFEIETIDENAEGVTFAMGDINGDGFADLARRIVDVELRLGGPQGWSQVFIDSLPAGQEIGLIDLDFDGRDELVIGGLGPGQGLRTVDFAGAPLSFDVVTSGPLVGISDTYLRGPFRVADVNSDGLPDLVGRHDDGVSVAIGRGDGSFEAARALHGAEDVIRIGVEALGFTGDQLYTVGGDGALEVTRIPFKF